MEMKSDKYSLAELTTEEFALLLNGNIPVVVLLPVGVLEPHGPHLPLFTDTAISHYASIRAAQILAKNELTPLIAPAVHYGVTECARSFKGAVSISYETLSSLLKDIINSFLNDGVEHVCIINNHLEPVQNAAIYDAIEGIESSKVSIACPLKKRWARTLSEEFKRGECHAGKYETSLMMSAVPDLVKDQKRIVLPEVSISLSEKLKAGVNEFLDMGLSQAYSGAPAKASVEHGNEILDKLAEMIVVEVLEATGSK